MSKCLRCNLSILDDTIRCPLCNGVLQYDIKPEDKTNENKTEDEEIDLDNYTSKSIMYPDVTVKLRRMNFFIRLFIFISIAAELVLCIINYLTYKGVMWSLICGVGLLYACFTLVFSFKRNKGHRTKVVIQSIGAMILAVLIDFIIGYTGWSVDYFIPSVIMMLDLVFLILILCNLSTFQNYIWVQIIIVAISLLYLICIPTHIVNNPLLSLIAAGVSCLMLLGIVIVGDKKAITEITRRLRI